MDRRVDWRYGETSWVLRDSREARLLLIGRQEQSEGESNTGSTGGAHATCCCLKQRDVNGEERQTTTKHEAAAEEATTRESESASTCAR